MFSPLPAVVSLAVNVSNATVSMPLKVRSCLPAGVALPGAAACGGDVPGRGWKGEAPPSEHNDQPVSSPAGQSTILLAAQLF